jgi:putative PIN family toxin of toxin-antitoxin system
LIELLLEEKIDLYITDEILFEYEEVLRAKYSEIVATNFLTALKELPNVYFAHIYFRWSLISDPDDNKFVDCYVAAGAHYLISHDTHFSILKRTAFPKVNIVRIQEFENILKTDVYPQ